MLNNQNLIFTPFFNFESVVNVSNMIWNNLI